MGKSKDLATGVAYQDQTESDTRYVNASGDTITGDTVISTTTQNQLRLENTAANNLGSYLKIRDGNSTAGQHTWIGRSANDTYIYGNNNDLGMKITGDSTNGGIVTKPNQPAFGAFGYSGTTTQLGGYNPLLWSNVHTNIGNCFNNSTGKFTFPVSGRYHYFCNVNLKSSDGSWLGLYLIYNGTGQINSWSRNATNFDYNNTIVSGVTDATANDYLAFAWHPSYVSPIVNNSSYVFASIHLIG